MMTFWEQHKWVETGLRVNPLPGITFFCRPLVVSGSPDGSGNGTSGQGADAWWPPDGTGEQVSALILIPGSPGLNLTSRGSGKDTSCPTFSAPIDLALPWWRVVPRPTQRICLHSLGPGLTGASWGREGCRVREESNLKPWFIDFGISYPAILVEEDKSGVIPG